MILSLLFAAALFVSAALIFWVQPLVGKMLLPMLGGTPAVWNTCMLFYQGTLLAGYGYALVLGRRLSPRAQALIQLLLLVLAALLLPFHVKETHLLTLPRDQNPVFWLLEVLVVSVGLPFFILSANGPLLQSWFAQTGHPWARDPYFLYAASNLGSFIALLAFPLVLEPNLTLGSQSRFWAMGYGALTILIAASVAAAWRAGPRNLPETPANGAPDGGPNHDALTMTRRLFWLLLAFIPSSLMLGATAYISTDIAAVPLLWVIPLAIYLLTFVMAFARLRDTVYRRIADLFPGTALILTFVYLSGAAEPAWFLVPLHLFFFLLAALLCHGRLAGDRPAAAHLVEYYFWIALGGMAGGLFNALIAPALFSRIVEYPLGMMLACLLYGRSWDKDDRGTARRLDIIIPGGIFLLTSALAFLMPAYGMSHLERLTVILGIPMLLSYAFRQRPIRLGLAVGAIMLGGSFNSAQGPRLLHRERSFFGVLRVTVDAMGNQHQLLHGDTVHGKQFTSEMLKCEPLAYYHRRGPLGDVFEASAARISRARIAVIGLGAGAMAAYALPGQEWTFYEIDPAVVEIAQDPRYFTYLEDCARAPIRIVLGDARLRLSEAHQAQYALLVLDAFSSDAIPVHLITREAIELYFSRLAPGGMLAFHISNRSLDLSRVLAGLTASQGLAGFVCDDKERDVNNGKDPSRWAVLARNASDLGSLTVNPRWKPLTQQTRSVVWSDDFSNLLHVLKWY